MTIIDAVRSVRDWMQLYQQETPSAPLIPAGKVRRLRHKLNLEEMRELNEATTPAEALDAIGDTLYVVLGAAVAYGFTGEQVLDAFVEVHRSNLTKFWTAEDLAKVDTAGSTITAVGKDDDGFTLFIVKDKDGKVIKSPSYSPADMDSILNP